MGNLDVMTVALVRLLGIDPLNIPVPVQLLGFTMSVLWIAGLVWVIWTFLRFALATVSDILDVHQAKHSIAIARGLTKHDFDQIRRGIKAWRLLLVRYGPDEYLRGMASDADRALGRTRFDVINMKLALSNIGEVTLTWNLPVHRRLGTQFRCYIDLREGGVGSDVLTGMLSHYDEILVQPPESAHPQRVYFLLKRFRIVTSADGVKQNIVMPG